MAASAVGPPSGAAAAAILSASLGYAHYDVTHSAKVANIPSSQFAARPGGGRSLRVTRPDPQTDERSRTRLFKADEAFHERDATVLATKRGFADYLDAVDEVTQGDVIPYHMPDTVVPGVNDDAAIVIDLINRAGGYFALYKAFEFNGSIDYSVNITLDALSKPCVFFFILSPLHPPTLIVSLE